MALPIYLAVALLVTRAWHPVPDWITTRLDRVPPRAARDARVA
jgi:hypothetical protein